MKVVAAIYFRLTLNWNSEQDSSNHQLLWARIPSNIFDF